MIFILMLIFVLICIGFSVFYITKLVFLCICAAVIAILFLIYAGLSAALGDEIAVVVMTAAVIVLITAMMVVQTTRKRREERLAANAAKEDALKATQQIKDYPEASARPSAKPVNNWPFPTL